MELVNVLRALAARPRLLGLAAAAAIAIGVLASGSIAIGPWSANREPTGAASTSVLVDSPQPAVADLSARNSVTATQALLLADRLASAPSTEVVARAAGIAPRDLTIVSTPNEDPVRPTELELAASDAATTSTTPYRLTVTATIAAPVIDVVAEAPSTAAADRLARAAAPGLELLTRDGGYAPARRIRVRPLGTVTTEVVPSAVISNVKGVLVGLLAFGALASAIVLAGGLSRRLRFS